MHILIAGGSGFLGTYLSQALAQRGYEVTILSRKPEKTDAKPHIRIVYWDGQSIMLPSKKPVDIVINLCGLSIARYWSQTAKKNIHLSRIQPTRALVKWIKHTHPTPTTMIQISGIDYYDITTPICDENTPPGNSFLARMTKEWESETATLCPKTTRLVIARLSPVFANTHPPLKPLIQTTWLGLGCIISPGTQNFSWIHHQDFTNIIQTMIENNNLKGPYNICAPSPTSYIQLMKALSIYYNRPLWLKMPTWIIQKILGEVATLVIDNRNVSAKKIQQHYTFQYPTIDQAIAALGSKG